MNELDTALEVEGRGLIMQEAARKHELRKWEHEEKLAKIASETFSLADVLWCCCISSIFGGLIGLLLAAVGLK